MRSVSSKITNAKIKAYEAVRQSGITNMFDVKTVERLSGLQREDIFDIMKNYGKYMKQFNIKRK